MNDYGVFEKWKKNYLFIVFCFFFFNVFKFLICCFCFMLFFFVVFLLFFPIFNFQFFFLFFHFSFFPRHKLSFLLWQPIYG